MPEYCVSSGSKTADAIIVDGPGRFYGIVVATDATNAVTVSIYDGLSATTLLIPTFIVPTSATNRSQMYIFNIPITFNVGLFVDVTFSGGASSYAVFYAR
jgi:hypothetical protein